MDDVAYTGDPPSVYRVDYTHRRLTCSNGHESDGAYVQMIGDHSYCVRCLAAMLDAFGARVREGA